MNRGESGSATEREQGGSSETEHVEAWSMSQIGRWMTWGGLRGATFATALVDLPPAFVDYLENGRFVMPLEFFPKYNSEPDDEYTPGDYPPDEEGGGDEPPSDTTTATVTTTASSEVEEQGEQVAHGSDDLGSFRELEETVNTAIQRLGGSVFCKTNWSSAKDAVWMTQNCSAKVTNFSELVLLLKSSDFIAQDFEQARQFNFPITLALREFRVLNPSMEMRCVVVDSVLVCACQRNCNIFHAFLYQCKAAMREALIAFFHDHLSGFPLSDYIFDVYFVSTTEIILVDVSPLEGSSKLPLVTCNSVTVPNNEAS
ncbi:cell division cycle protein [Pelomyxa schiedti]|nr:cell division cycle protein [Pelomyxa schiedti]